MFKELIELIVSVWNDLKPFYIINQWEEGVHLRFGKFLKKVTPGIHFKVSFADDILATTVVMTTMKLPPQSLYTKDDKAVVIETVLKYYIFDVVTFNLKVYDALDALSDTTQGIVKEEVVSKAWEDLRTQDIDSNVTKKERVEAKKWGIYLEKATLVTLSKSPSLRLITQSTIPT